MKADILSFRSNDESQPILTAAWIVIVTTATITFSLSFACATPLAAVAAVAGVHMKRHEGTWLVLTAWLANQLVGYYLLHYPCTWDSFAWGAAIGIASLFAAVGARGRLGRHVRPSSRRSPPSSWHFSSMKVRYSPRQPYCPRALRFSHCL